MIKIEKSIYLTSEIKCNLGNLTKSTSNNDALTKVIKHKINHSEKRKSLFLFISR